MARRRSRAEILADIEGLKKQLAESEEKEERRIGRIANKAGLLDVEAGDDELAKAFADLAARFRKGAKSSTAAGPPAAPAPNGVQGSEGAGHRDGG